MKRATVALGAALMGLAVLANGPCFAKEDALEWTVLKRIDLQAEPVDTATSEDGKWIFVLSPGEVQVYSVKDARMRSRIPVGREFDKLLHSPAHDALILTSKAKKSMEMVRLEFIQEISTEGLPMKGPEQAAVTVAVFDDYQ